MNSSENTSVKIANVGEIPHGKISHGIEKNKWNSCYEWNKCI